MTNRINNKKIGKSKKRKHQGICQSGGNKGKLKRGYKYSGQRTKSGLPIILKVNKSKKQYNQRGGNGKGGKLGIGDIWEPREPMEPRREATRRESDNENNDENENNVESNEEKKTNNKPNNNNKQKRCKKYKEKSKSLVELLKDGLEKFSFYDDENNVRFNFIDEIPILGTNECKFIDTVKIETKWNYTVEQIGMRVKEIFGTVTFEELFKFVFKKQDLKGIDKFLSEYNDLRNNLAKFDEIRVKKDEKGENKIYFQDNLIDNSESNKIIMLNNIFDLFLDKLTIEKCKEILKIINSEISLFYNSDISDFKPKNCVANSKDYHCQAYNKFKSKASTLYNLYEIYKTNIEKHHSNIMEFLKIYWDISGDLSQEIYNKGIIGNFPVSIDILQDTSKIPDEKIKKIIKNILYTNLYGGKGQTGKPFWRAGIFYPGAAEGEGTYTFINAPFTRETIKEIHATALEIHSSSPFNPSIFLAFCTNMENECYGYKDYGYDTFALYHELGHNIAAWKGEKDSGVRSKYFAELCDQNPASKDQIQYVNIGEYILKLTNPTSEKMDVLKEDDEFGKMINSVITNNEYLIKLKEEGGYKDNVDFKKNIMENNKFMYWLFDGGIKSSMTLPHGPRINDLVCDVMATDIIITKYLKDRELDSASCFEYITGIMKSMAAGDSEHFHWFRRLIFTMLLLPKLKLGYDKSYNNRYLDRKKKNDKIKKDTNNGFKGDDPKYKITLTPNEKASKEKDFDTIFDKKVEKFLNKPVLGLAIINIYKFALIKKTDFDYNNERLKLYKKYDMYYIMTDDELNKKFQHKQKKKKEFISKLDMMEREYKKKLNGLIQQKINKKNIVSLWKYLSSEQSSKQIFLENEKRELLKYLEENADKLEENADKLEENADINKYNNFIKYWATRSEHPVEYRFEEFEKMMKEKKENEGKTEQYIFNENVSKKYEMFKKDMINTKYTNRSAKIWKYSFLTRIKGVTKSFNEKFKDVWREANIEKKNTIILKFLFEELNILPKEFPLIEFLKIFPVKPPLIGPLEKNPLEKIKNRLKNNNNGGKKTKRLTKTIKKRNIKKTKKNVQTGENNVRKHQDVIRKSCKKKSKKLTKITRKHQGIIQSGGNRGRLKKGYKYSGQRTKSGLPIIIKIK